MSERGRKFFDQCHRFNWVLSLIGQLLLLVYFTGQYAERVNAIQQRVTHIEQQVDALYQVFLKGGSR